MYTCRSKIRARYPECDRMGIVYHSNYIIWFDIARTEFLRSLGYSYKELEDEGVWLPVIEVGCKYKSPVKYDEEVEIEAYIEKLSRVKITFGYKVYKGNEVMIEGTTSHGFTNNKLKPIGLNRVRPEVFERLSQCLD